MPKIIVTPGFPILERVISRFYGQGALSPTRKHDDIWLEIEQSYSLPDLRKLLLELQALQSLDDNDLLNLW
jgi:hypothetical protein